MKFTIHTVATILSVFLLTSCATNNTGNTEKTANNTDTTYNPPTTPHQVPHNNAANVAGSMISPVR